MVKMRSYITVVLFTVGLILSIGGFMLDKADKVPFVLKIAVPEYSDGLNAFDELMNRGPCIKEDDKGFFTLANLALSAMEGNISKTNVKVIKICRTGEPRTTIGNSLKSGVPINITINIELPIEMVSTRPDILKSYGLMKRGQCLKEGVDGFSTLANLTISALGALGDVSNAKIVKICDTGAITNYNDTMKSSEGLNVIINREQTLEWFSYELEPLLKNLGENSLFSASATVFSLGIILNILSFIIERRKDKNENN